MTSLLKNYASFTSHSKPTVGDLKMSAVTQDHLGWLLCDGRQLTVSEWRFLFNIIGYQFGGSGSTFNLPDAQGRVAGAVGTGTSPNLTPRTLGNEVGTETHTLTIAEMPRHTHGSEDTIDPPGSADGNGFTAIEGDHTHNATSANDDFNNNSGDYPVGSQPSFDAYDSGTRNWTGTGFINTNGAHQHAIGRTGGSDAHNNMQPTLFMGSQFIYSGKPTYGTWPLTYNPPSLGPYGGQPQIQ
jgi:microcystin-dependent protein